MSAGFFILASLAWTGALALAAQILARGRGPYFAQAVWRGAAFLMALPWLAAGVNRLWPRSVQELPMVSDLSAASADMIGAVPGFDAAGEGMLSLPATSQIVVWVLILGWGFRAACAVAAQARLQRMKAASTPADSSYLDLSTAKWADRLGLSKTPSVRRLHGVTSPFIAGFAARRIYLPDSIDEASGALIAAHECVHLKRGDLITRPLERAVADLLFFSPFAWHARRQLDHYREAVCDAETVKLTGDRVAYARVLTQAARMARQAPQPLPVSALLPRGRRSLPRRVESILKPDHAGRGATAGLALAAFLVATPIALAQGVQAVEKKRDIKAVGVVIDHPHAKITSGFGMRQDPFTGNPAWHRGIDIGAPEGTPVSSPIAGTVVFSGKKGAYGEMIDVKCKDGDIFRFAQLKKRFVKEGEEIEAGAEIGKVGQSGRASGPHLHFEYIKHGEPYDPSKSGICLTPACAS